MPLAFLPSALKRVAAPFRRKLSEMRWSRIELWLRVVDMRLWQPPMSCCNNELLAEEEGAVAVAQEAEIVLHGEVVDGAPIAVDESRNEQ